MSRKLLLVGLLAGFVALASGAGIYLTAERTAQSPPLITVFKTPDCGCCTVWEDYLRDEGFTVDSRMQSHQEMSQIKHELGLTPELASCHTGIIEGYVVEGHVPAREIRRLLEERPEARGITVPRMPIGSPGMEFGDRYDPYDVLLFQEGGKTEIYASYHQD
jgi:hypothetical protein